MPLHSLTNFEIKKYYHKKPKFNGIYTRNDLFKIKDGVYVINLDEYESIGTRCIPLYVNDNRIYFDSLEMNIFQKRILKIIRNKNIPTFFW